MGFELKDGTGKGYIARVDETNSLFTRSVTETAQLEAAINGENFFVGTPFITQLSSGENGLLYFSPNEDVEIFATSFSSQARFTTGGTTSNYLILMYSGIPVSALTGSWTDFTPLNLNFGSSKTLSGTFKFGASGAAGGNAGYSGTPKIQLGFPINQYNQINTNLVVQKGQTLLLTVTPPASNTNMPVNFGISVAPLRYR